MDEVHLRAIPPSKPDMEPPLLRPVTLHLVWRAALFLFPFDLIMVYLLERSIGLSPTAALAQSLGNPLVGIPAIVVVTTSALKLYLPRRQLRRQERAYRVKLTALKRVLFDASEPNDVRELAACAIARMDPNDAIPLLHKATALPPADYSAAHALFYSHGIWKAFLIARGAPPTVWHRLSSALQDPNPNRRVDGRHGLEALSRLAARAQERYHTGGQAADLLTDLADADAVVLALLSLRMSESESKDIGEELLTDTEGESTPLASGGVRWQE